MSGLLCLFMLLFLTYSQVCLNLFTDQPDLTLSGKVKIKEVVKSVLQTFHSKLSFRYAGQIYRRSTDWPNISCIF
jgi:hypothetical protein